MSSLVRKILSEVIMERWNDVWKSSLRTMANDGSVSIAYGENMVELTINDIDALTALIAGFDDGSLIEPDKIVAAKVLKCVGFAIVDGELYWQPIPVTID